MEIEQRPSGMPEVGDVAWGAHFCQFYGQREDLIDSLVPFFKAGLEHNEQCLWVTSEPFRAADARAMLGAAVRDLDQRIARGQIEIIDHHDWYMRAGDRTASEVLQGWVDRHDAALAGGYDGLRLTGNTYWLERNDWAGFREYESRVTRTFEGKRIIGLCSYCSSKCQGTDVLDVIRNHQFALVREDGEWQLIESAALKEAKQELRELNRQLEDRVKQRTAELEDALQIRDQFLSVASHELKTPITSLQLYVEGLLLSYAREPVAPEVATRRLDKIKGQCGRLERLINQLLDVSRATSGGRLPMDVEDVDLAELTRAACEASGEALRRAGCELVVDADRPVNGSWDPMRLEQVLANLLNNAVRHAPGTRVVVEVREVDDRAVLTVRDGGPGVPEGESARIFERFVQAGPRPDNGGFGLGLWIVREIAEAHGGEATVDSQPGSGAAFTVSLPRQPGS
jgi:signal transduction histidine kinase